MKNSLNFEEFMYATGRVFKVTDTGRELFGAIQNTRPTIYIPIDYDEVMSKSNEEYFDKLYFTTDFTGLYYMDEESLSFISANPLEILRVPHNLPSVAEKIATSKDLTGDLLKLIFRIEKPQRTTALELLEQKFNLATNDKETWRELVVEVRKHADVYFRDFDRKFTSKLDYQNPKTEGTTVIYRGENARSQDYHKTYSWTTDKKKAQWFANRFENGKLLKATVPNNKIIYAYQDDDEKEVLVKARDLMDIAIETK